MTIRINQIGLFLSGGTTNTDQYESLGDVISDFIVGSQMYDDIDKSEAIAGDIEYRCFYVKNLSATDTLNNAVVFMNILPSSPVIMSIGLDPVGLDGTATTITDENTAPTGVTFSTTAVSAATGLSLGAIPAGSFYAVWLKREVPATATPTAAQQEFSLKVAGETT